LGSQKLTVTYFTPFVVSVGVQVQVFTAVGITCSPGPTDTPTSALTWSWVTTEQASFEAGVAPQGVVETPNMNMATISAATLVFARVW
jgi:hypothetical protein